MKYRAHRKLVACRWHSAKAAHLYRNGRGRGTNFRAEAVHQSTDLQCVP